MAIYQEELAALKRQHVTRSLSFTADIFGGDVNDGSVYDKNDNDANNSSSLKDLQNPNKQVSCHYICLLDLMTSSFTCCMPLRVEHLF
jgi:hypothetical protein